MSAILENRNVSVAELEALGYTHVRWTCRGCGLDSSRGFRLMRVRGKIDSTTTLTAIDSRLRCARCQRLAEKGSSILSSNRDESTL
jgi:hypothetical protein